MIHHFDHIFKPKKIAVIGGGEWNRSVIDQLRKLNFSGQLWSVHPSNNEFAGLKPFKSVSDLPDAPDVSFIGVNRLATIDALRELDIIGCKSAVCFASGFAEAQDGQHINSQLLEAAGDMTILGPNCYGLLNMLDGIALWPDEHGLKQVDKGVAILGQSSNILINLGMQRRGLPISHMVACGNQIQIGFADIGTYLLEDDRVSALGIHIEGFGDVHKFQILASRAYELGKPIVVLKVGATEAAKNATLSHTASLAGSDAGASALLARCGVARADGLTDFLSLLTVGHVLGRKQIKSISSASCSGGEAVLISDAAANYPIDFPPLNDGQISNLKTCLSDLVKLDNPLDYHTQIWRDVDRMSYVYEQLAAGNTDLNCLILDFPRSDRCLPTGHELAFEALLKANKSSSNKFALIATLSENLPESIAETAIENGVVPFFKMTDAITAMAKTQQWSTSVNQPVLVAPKATDTQTMSEYDAKQQLQKIGISIPNSELISSIEVLAEASTKMGFPLVLKGDGAAHKTEAGMVALDLNSSDDVMRAAARMTTSMFIIEQMFTGDNIELLIGIVHDPAHGYVLTIGAGGTLAELIADKTSLLIPASRDEVQAAIEKTKISKLLKGYRRKPAKNMNAVLDVIEKLQSYIGDNAGNIMELEINPLMVSENSAIAVDALIVRSK